MSDRKLRQLPLAIAAMVASMGAQAEYQSPDGNFRMSGFGTVGVVRTDTNEAKLPYAGQPEGATKKASADLDSKVAVQGTYKFTPTVSATTQVMTKYSGDGAYESDFEWAFAKWQALPSLTVRAGRMGAPLFMISDFRDVGYANTFVRPPADVYDQVPFGTVDGGDISLQHTFGAVTMTGQIWGGNAKNTFGETKLSVERLRGVNIVAEIDGGYTLRVGRVSGKMSYNTPSLTALVQGAASAQQNLLGGAQILEGFGQSAAAAQTTAYANQFGAIGDFATAENADASFTGIGFGVDHDDFIASVEFTKRKTKSFVADTTGWYAMVGYRLGSYTPYVVVSKMKVDRLKSNPVAADAVSNLDGLGLLTAGDVADLKDLRAGVDQVNDGTNSGQKTLSFGVRWDVARSMALKAQLDHIKTDGGPGLFNAPSALEPVSDRIRAGKAVNALTLSLDFVF